MNLSNNIVIFPLKTEFIKDIHSTNDEFEIFGKMVPSLHNGKWTYEEILFDETLKMLFSKGDLFL